ncbi:hypothetical protein Phage2-1_00039 [Achromobacter phage 2-1]|nr:hypothetical protein Phage2-1_00039 [Achromobacter phage 2-1]
MDATVETVDGYAADALASKNAAAASKDAAAISETNAGTSASAAAGSATAAAASKSGADTAKNAAASSASAAATSEGNAAGSATTAGEKATAASSSASQAAQHSADANTYADAAFASKGAAETSAGAASASASEALAHRNAAAGSATAASGSKDAAAGSATAAADSATAAAASKDAAQAAVASIGTSVSDAAASASAAATSASQALGYRNTAETHKNAAAQSASDAAAAAAGWQGGLAEAGIPNAKVLSGTVDWQTLDKTGTFILPSIGTNGPPVGSYFATVIADVKVAADGSRTITAYLNALATTWSAQVWTLQRRPSGVWKRWECAGNFGYRYTKTLNGGSTTLSADDRGVLLSVVPSGNPVITLPQVQSTTLNVGDAFTFYNNFISYTFTIKANGTDEINVLPGGGYPRDSSNNYFITLSPGESITLVVDAGRAKWIPLNYSKAPSTVRLSSGPINLNTLVQAGIYGFLGRSVTHADSVGFPPGSAAIDGKVEVSYTGYGDIFQRLTLVDTNSNYKPAVFERVIQAGTSVCAWRYVAPLTYYSQVNTADCGPVYIDEVGDYCEWNTTDAKYYKVKSYSTRITWTFSTPWRPPAWAKWGRLHTIIGGGGGGGTGPASTSGIAGAGGAGGLAGSSVSKGDSYIGVTLTPGTSMNVVVGAGGAGGNDNVNGSPGGDGGSSSFAGVTSAGGGGGSRATGVFPGDLGILGERGWPAAQANQVGGKGGDGQPSPLGPGGRGGKGGTAGAQPGAGSAAPNYSYGAGGGGGGGSVNNVGPARSGGGGNNGLIVLEY